MNSTTRVGVMLAMLAGAGGCTTDMGEMRPTAELVPETIAPAPMDAIAATTVTLEQPLHFVGPGETDVLVPAGQYQVQQGEASQLKLIGKEQPKPVLLAAIALSHDENIDVPTARIVAGEEDTQRVFLLTPGGTGLAAVGSESGLGGRGIASMIGGIKTLNAPAPIQQIYYPPGGWIKASNGTIPKEAFPAGRNNFGSVYICRGSLPSTPGSLWVGGIWPLSKGCRTVNGPIANYEVLAPFWGYATNGSIPPGAMGVGSGAGGQLIFYTCRAYYDGGWLAGKISTQSSGCEIGWKGRAVVVQGYDVLLKSFVTPKSSSGNGQTLSSETIQSAMPLGKPGPDSRTGAPCITNLNGARWPGRLSVADQGCAIAYGTIQANQREFDTLQGFWRGGVDARSLVAGKKADDPRPQLYACMRVSAGSNETAVGYFGGPFQTCEFIYPDGKTGRDRLDQVKILGDWYQDLVPNWDPKVK